MANEPLSLDLSSPESIAALSAAGLLVQVNPVGARTSHHIEILESMDGGRWRIDSPRPIEIRDMGPMNDQATLVIVKAGRWALYEHSDFRGRELIFDRGFHNLGDYGFNDQLSSFKAI